LAGGLIVRFLSANRRATVPSLVGSLDLGKSLIPKLLSALTDTDIAAD
jgi:hypothetical protein